ncbi:hypothetical protein V9K67_14390 [Paraflavisolibacter sp. H34]|uniref:hypothetical protein n=1 Tax=Huijunlia imazamoxiresistens TaxID=3127457 RepID=UPI0030189573
MKPRLETLIRKPLPAKRYTGKDAIRELYAALGQLEREQPQLPSDEDDAFALACEENYDLYFPRPDTY